MGKLQERDVLLEPWFSISIGGAKLDEDMLKYVTSVEVVDEEKKLSEATIEVADMDMKWLNGAGIGKESSISIQMGHKKNNSGSFNGKITMIDVDYPVDGFPTLVVKAVDKGVNMMKVRKTKIHKQKKISDLVKKMHKDAGLNIECEDSKTIFDHVPQNKETDLEFTQRWRKNLGWKYYKKPTGDYYFGTKNKSEFPIETLGYRKGGMEIISFSPTFAEIETEDEKDENEVDNKNATKKTDANKKSEKPKAGSSGSSPVKGKA